MGRTGDSIRINAYQNPWPRSSLLSHIYQLISEFKFIIPCIF